MRKLMFLLITWAGVMIGHTELAYCQPVARDVVVANIVNNYAQVTFHTFALTQTAEVFYGVDPNNLNMIDSLNNGSTGARFHVIPLTGLTANTTYYFRIKAVNANGSSLSSTLNFRTSQALQPHNPLDLILKIPSLAAGQGLAYAQFEGAKPVMGTINSLNLVSIPLDRSTWESDGSMVQMGFVQNHPLRIWVNGGVAGWYEESTTLSQLNCGAAQCPHSNISLGKSYVYLGFFAMRGNKTRINSSYPSSWGGPYNDPLFVDPLYNPEVVPANQSQLSSADLTTLYAQRAWLAGFEVDSDYLTANPGGAPISLSDLENAAKGALQTWSEADLGGSPLKLIYGGATPANAPNRIAKDNRNTIRFETQSTFESAALAAVAITLITVDLLPDGRMALIDTDIALNGYENTTNRFWVTNGTMYVGTSQARTEDPSSSYVVGYPLTWCVVPRLSPPDSTVTPEPEAPLTAAEELYGKAMAALYDGDLREAIRLFRQVIQRYPNDLLAVHALVSLAHIHREHDLPGFSGYLTGLLHNPQHANLQPVINDLLNWDVTGAAATITADAAAATMSSAKDETAQGLPLTFKLEHNYPNPFAASTSIRFGLPVEQPVRVAVYSVTGQKIKTLADGVMPAGFHSVDWNGRGQSDEPVAAGVYFYEVQAGQERLVRKMVLTR